MTKTKQFCTDEEYLQSFAHKHRIVDSDPNTAGGEEVSLSTYVEALPQLVNRRTGRIHTSFNQAGDGHRAPRRRTPTCRTSPCARRWGAASAKAFIPSDDDHLLLSADYSQVELRLMAHLSGATSR